MGMKFIVDEMPKSKSKCRFSEWESYPPILDKPGHYICKINGNDCDLCETECQLLKEQQTIVHCRDCKHWTHKGSIFGTCKDGHYRAAYWFCADGERNDENG